MPWFVTELNEGWEAKWHNLALWSIYSDDAIVCLIEGDNETLVSVLCCFYCESLPKAHLAPGRALSWLLAGCNEDHGSYQLFRHTQWLLFTWGTLGSVTEVWGMEQWQPPTCPCLNLQERDLREASGRKLCHKCCKPAVTDDSNLRPLPQQWAARGWSCSSKAQAEWHRATGLTLKVWGAQA